MHLLAQVAPVLLRLLPHDITFLLFWQDNVYLYMACHVWLG